MDDLTGAHQVLLTDDISQRGRAHPLGEGYL